MLGSAPQTPDPVAFTDMTPPLTGYYVVTAVNSSGAESGFSNELCVQPGADNTVLVANFMNGNNSVLNSRVYLWNPSTERPSNRLLRCTERSCNPKIEE